jgi:uncharacterized membrane protein
MKGIKTMNTIIFKALLAVAYFLAYAVLGLLIIRPTEDSFWFISLEFSIFTMLFPFVMHLMMYLDKDFGFRGEK